jgi:DNA-directed RNA polymerase subunit RPC12/RpoP
MLKIIVNDSGAKDLIKMVLIEPAFKCPSCGSRLIYKGPQGVPLRLQCEKHFEHSLIGIDINGITILLRREDRHIEP